MNVDIECNEDGEIVKSILYGNTLFFLDNHKLLADNSDKWKSYPYELRV